MKMGVALLSRDIDCNALHALQSNIVVAGLRHRVGYAFGLGQTCQQRFQLPRKIGIGGQTLFEFSFELALRFRVL